MLRVLVYQISALLDTQESFSKKGPLCPLPSSWQFINFIIRLGGSLVIKKAVEKKPIKIHIYLSKF